MKSTYGGRERHFVTDTCRKQGDGIKMVLRTLIASFTSNNGQKWLVCIDQCQSQAKYFSSLSLS